MADLLNQERCSLVITFEGEYAEKFSFLGSHD